MQNESRGSCRCVYFIRKTVLPFLVLAIILVSTGLALHAQEMGSIVGTVTDPSGAAIPGARITVTNQQTGVVARETTTNTDGNFAIPALPTSTYSVRAEKKASHPPCIRVLC